MSFKVGDKVRLTRKALHNKCASPTRNEVFGGEVNNIDKDGYHTVEGFEDDYLEQSLELVPEKPEFEYGEEIEVTNDGDNWFKRIFITKSKECRYVCVDHTCYSSFKNGRQYTVAFYDSARKSIPQLTRKEIANRFGVSENFILIDDVNVNGV